MAARRRQGKATISRSGQQANHQCTTSPLTGTCSNQDVEDASEIQEQLLDQIEEGAKLCRKVEAQLRAHPAPGLETIVELYRVLVLKLSGELQAQPQTLTLINALIKPVLDWERLEEKRKDRELEQQKYRDQQAAREAAQLAQKHGRDGALQDATLNKIERELNLF
jgi:hypothetical protein